MSCVARLERQLQSSFGTQRLSDSAYGLLCKLLEKVDVITAPAAAPPFALSAQDKQQLLALCMIALFTEGKIQRAFELFYHKSKVFEGVILIPEHLSQLIGLITGINFFAATLGEYGFPGDAGECRSMFVYGDNYEGIFVRMKIHLEAGPAREAIGYLDWVLYLQRVIAYLEIGYEEGDADYLLLSTDNLKDNIEKFGRIPFWPVGFFSRALRVLVSKFNYIAGSIEMKDLICMFENLLRMTPFPLSEADTEMLTELRYMLEPLVLLLDGMLHRVTDYLRDDPALLTRVGGVILHQLLNLRLHFSMLDDSESLIALLRTCEVSDDERILAALAETVRHADAVSEANAKNPRAGAGRAGAYVRHPLR
jgi:hypothetical protein